MLNVSEVNAERCLEALPERASARFSEMQISPYVKERLAAARFATPTPVQAAAIPQSLAGKDVVATPGRLEDYLDRRLFHFNALRILILDEADRMLDMGFLPAIKRIVSILPKERQTMCFSATMEGDMARIVKDYLRNAVRLSFGSTSK